MTPLYQRVMGEAFDRMPPEIQAIHSFRVPRRASGRGSVARGKDLMARLVGWLFRFPPATDDVPVSVTFDVDEIGETWIRDFGGHRFQSRLGSRLKDNQATLTEHFGLFIFDFDLSGDVSGLEMRLSGWKCLDFPLPRAFLPKILATERVKDGRFHFDVAIALPWGKLIVRYKGWLVPDPATP